MSSLWWVMVMGAVLPILIGLIVDGGAVVDTRDRAARVAEQAARAGAAQIDAASYYDNGPTPSDATSAAAEQAAREYLARMGMSGSVVVAGNRVTVRVTDRYQTRWLGYVGLDSYSIVESDTAVAVE